MKPLTLHGPAIVSSRDKLLQLKKQFDQNSITSFERGAYSTEEVLESLQAVSLFDNKRLVIIENFPENLDFDFKTLNPSPETTAIFWFDHELKSKSKILGDLQTISQVMLFTEAKEASIFPLLDQLTQRTPGAYLELEKTKLNFLHKEKLGLDLQYLITMILYLLRVLTVIPKTSPPFVRNKLKNQQANFSPDEILGLYRATLEIDYKLKRGLIESSQAEFLLVSQFVKT